MHSRFLHWGLRIQNLLAFFKLIIVSVIVLSGFAALAGRVDVQPKPDNFAQGNVWKGTRRDANAFVSGLYGVIW